MTPTTELTARQTEVLDFIKHSIETIGYPPTVREMMDHFGFSPNGVTCHLHALERKKLIEIDKYQARAIRLVGYRVQLVPLA